MRIRVRLGSKSFSFGPVQIAVAEPEESLKPAPAVELDPTPSSAREAPKRELRAQSHRPAQLAPTIKTFTTSSIAQAMLLARAELGDDAILIQSKTAHTEPGSIVQYEVTFGFVPDGLLNDSLNVPDVAPKVEAPHETSRLALNAPDPIRPVAVIPAAAPEIAKSSSPSVLNSDQRQLARATRALATVRGELDDLHAMLQEEAGATSTRANKKALDVYSMLVQQDAGRDLALNIAAAVERRLKGEETATAEMVHVALSHVLASRIRCEHSVAGASKPIVLVGPPASGKTTALMKLALDSGVRNGRNLEVLSLDPRKAAPNKTLETMLEILGATYRAVKSRDSLRSELQRKVSPNTLLLVEAAGLTGNAAIDKELISAIQCLPELEVHLVLSTAWHPANIRKAVDRYEVFQPSYLLFTMFDQAATFGVVLREAVRTSKPLSYFGTGGLGAKYLEPSSSRGLVDRMCAAPPAD